MGILSALFGSFVLGLVAVMTPNAYPQSLTEADAKAAVLYNLATFAQWPDDEPGNSVFVIGVLGPDAVTASLSKIHGQVLNGRTLEVRELRPEDDPAVCDLLYIPSTHQRSAVLLRRIGTAPVLSVSDDENAIREGAAVRLYFEGSRLRIEIELAAVERAKIRISPKVLSLAQVRVLRNGYVVNSSTRP